MKKAYEEAQERCCEKALEKNRKKYKESECGLSTENLENFMKMIVLDFISRKTQNYQYSHGSIQRQIENNPFIDVPFEDID